MTQSLNFLSFWGRVGRDAYAVIGFLAFAVKHNLDRLLAQSQKLLWSPWNYWIPFGEMFRGAPSGPKEQELAKTLFLVALPFLWIAINVTVKRLRDAGQPLWLAFLAVVPVVNVLFFVLLCVLPSRTPYGDIKVRHLEDHDFQPERVDFVITRLPNGNSRLEGTTTYQNKMWPGAYWRIWTGDP